MPLRMIAGPVLSQFSCKFTPSIKCVRVLLRCNTTKLCRTMDIQKAVCKDIEKHQANYRLL